VDDREWERLETHPELRVVLSMREDVLGQFDAKSVLLEDFLRRRYRLEQMRRPAALEAVRRPAELAGRRWADGVAERLVDDLLTVRMYDEVGETRPARGEFVDAVSLQVVCHALWAHLPAAETLITTEHLQRFGDVDTILASFYDAAVRYAAEVCNLPEFRIRESIESYFITDVNTRGTAYRNKSVTAGLPNDVLDILEQQHLLRAYERAGARWYELTHDRLIEPIQTANRHFRDNPVAAGIASGGAREHANLLTSRAERAASAEQFARALEDVAAAVAAYRAAGDEWAAANAVALNGDILYQSGQIEPAEAAWKEAAVQFEELGDRRALARVLSTLGSVTFHDHNDLVGAEEYFTRAIDLDPISEAYAARGSVAWYAGRDADAVADFTRALTIDRNLWAARNGRGQVPMPLS
jgi:tetratricopeptide (TPR) repeat protein